MNSSIFISSTSYVSIYEHDIDQINLCGICYIRTLITYYTSRSQISIPGIDVSRSGRPSIDYTSCISCTSTADRQYSTWGAGGLQTDWHQEHAADEALRTRQPYYFFSGTAHSAELVWAGL